MAKNHTLKLYTDPGHGWVGVKVAFARDMGILESVSNYSYIKGKSIYLEEDGDLSCLCNAIRAKGETFDFASKHTDASHPIRSYNRATQENIAAVLATIA